MKRVKNTLNATEFAKDYEKTFGVSKTVPDQTMTMRQLLDRYARGLPLAGAKEPVYYGEEDLPELHRLDLAEIQELRESNKQRIHEQQQDLQRQQREEQAKKYPKKTASPGGGREGEKDKDPGSAGQKNLGSGADE